MVSMYTVKVSKILVLRMNFVGQDFNKEKVNIYTYIIIQILVITINEQIPHTDKEFLTI